MSCTISSYSGNGDPNEKTMPMILLNTLRQPHHEGHVPESGHVSVKDLNMWWMAPEQYALNPPQIMTHSEQKVWIDKFKNSVTHRVSRIIPITDEPPKDTIYVDDKGELYITHVDLLIQRKKMEEQLEKKVKSTLDIMSNFSICLIM